jgi:hypothetical protein
VPCPLLNPSLLLAAVQVIDAPAGTGDSLNTTSAEAALAAALAAKTAALDAGVPGTSSPFSSSTTTMGESVDISAHGGSMHGGMVVDDSLVAEVVAKLARPGLASPSCTKSSIAQRSASISSNGLPAGAITGSGNSAEQLDASLSAASATAPAAPPAPPPPPPPPLS